MSCCVGCRRFYDVCCVLPHKITFHLTSCQSVLHEPVWLVERYLNQFHMRLYQHGLLSYTDLFSLNEQQSRDYWLKYIKSLFIFIHVMFWTLLSNDDELKLFVPSAINPLTNNNVCHSATGKLVIKYSAKLRTVATCTHVLYIMSASLMTTTTLTLLHP